MDRDEALRLLRGGVEGIAEWNRRRGEGEIIPDLSGANLSGANLYEADLSKTNLAMAILDRTILDRTILDRANLSEANFRGTILADLDLAEVEGLDSVRHLGPCPISTSTLFRSRGKIPRTFLCGCGLTDVLIDSLPDLVDRLEPIQFYSCFISYSSKDEDFATRLHSRMRDQGLRVWFAPDDMRGGMPIQIQIDEAIHAFDKVLLVLSEASMGSKWVATELRHTRREEERVGRRKLFPIRLVGYEEVKKWELPDSAGEDLAEVVAEFFIPDFSNWKDDKAFEADFAHLLRDLRAADAPRA
jgi:hypothetical protein